MLIKMPKENAVFFECKTCDFMCSKKSDHARHLLTSKHKKLTNIENVNKDAKVFVCDLCSKQYFSRVGLWKHDKVCVNKPVKETHAHGNGHDDNEVSEKSKIAEITKEMFTELINHNKEMVNIIKDQHEQIKLMVYNIINTNINTHPDHNDAIP